MSTEPKKLSKVEFISKEDKKTKTKLLQEIHQELNLDREYFIALIGSAIIALYGLLTNSVAIIIGGMLIAPIFWPFLGIAMGIITQRQKILRSAIITSTVSVLVIIAIGFLGTWIHPITFLNKEILLRTHPNVIDLIIALVSSVVGVAALRFKKISASTIGVAISLSLLPALVVTGIGLNLGDIQIIYGSFLLFSANATAIVFAGCVTLVLLGAKPQYQKEKARFKLGFLLSFVAIIILAVPLSIFLNQSTQESRLKLKAENVFISNINSIQPNAKIDNFQVSIEGKELYLAANILIPETSILTKFQREEIADSLQKQLKKDINLQLTVINTVTLHQGDILEGKSFETSLQNKVEGIVSSYDKSFEVYQVTLVDRSVDHLSLDVILLQKDGQFFTNEQRQNLVSTLENFYDTSVSLEISIVSTNSIDQISIETKEKIFHQIKAMDDGIKVTQFTANEYNSSGNLIVSMVVLYPDNVELGPEQKDQIETILMELVPDAELELAIINYSR